MPAGSSSDSPASVDRHGAQLAPLPGEDHVADPREPLAGQVHHLSVEHVAPESQDAAVVRELLAATSLVHHGAASVQPFDPLPRHA